MKSHQPNEIEEKLYVLNTFGSCLILRSSLLYKYQIFQKIIFFSLPLLILIDNLKGFALT